MEGDKNHSGNMLANKNTLLRKEGQMHKKCINFVQVNAIVNTVEYIGLIMLLYWHIYIMSLALLKICRDQLRIILDKNTYFLKGQGVGVGGKYDLRADPHRYTKMTLYFLVNLTDMAVKIAIKMLAGFERVIFTNNLTVTFVKKLFLTV